MSSGEEFKPGS